MSPAAALSPDARHAARLQSGAPETFRLYCRVVDAKAGIPAFLGAELSPLYRRLRVLEAELGLLLESGREVQNALRWSAEAVCRRAEQEARQQ